MPYRRITLVAVVSLAATACRPRPHLTADPEGRDLPIAVQAHPEPPEPGPPARARCADEGWLTYGHDAARTSASGGCLVGPLRRGWTFSPRSSAGATTYATRAVVQGDSVYVAGAIGPTPSLWRLDVRDGKATWSYDSHTESVRGGWPTLVPELERVYLVDDGVNGVDLRTGVGRRAELDAWGESLSDGARLYAENDWYLDGYGLYLSAFDAELHLLWRRDYNALARGVMVPDVGGLALDRGVLVHAAQHGALTGSGLSAFDPSSGERRWRVRVSPMSSPSLAGGRVLAIERWPSERIDRLVARALDDGSLVWATTVADARGPAPVLAGELVLVHANDGVHAFEAATGTPRWFTPLPRTTQPVQSATTIAAATGSGTLVVLSGSTIHVLRQADGSEPWPSLHVEGARHVEAPAIVGRSLYVVADGKVVRFEGERDD